MAFDSSDTPRPPTPGPSSTPPRSRVLASPRLRWAVPVGAVAVLTGGIALSSTRADAEVQLPPRTAAQLLADVAKAPQQPLSGTVVETARLGLPELPGQAAGTSLQSLVTGSHTARVWFGTDGKARVSLVGDLAETDVVRNGGDVWLWSSQKNEATHYKLPAGAAAKDTKPPATPGAQVTDPAAAARQALAAIDPTTQVQVDGTGRVAGQAVYELRLTPRDARSLIGSVRIAVDGDTSVPLRVQVFARGAAEPAFETGFTSVQFGRPDDAVFSFTPPKGAKVTEGTVPSARGEGAPAPQKTSDRATPDQKSDEKPGDGNVVGTGWTAVAVMQGVDIAALGQDATAGALLKATTPVTLANGTTGRLLRTPLVSVLLVGNQAFVGAVDPAVVEQVASTRTSR